MAYTKSQFVLNPNTAPANLGNAVGRSAIADAATAATNIISSMENLKNTKVQNESAELSLQTRILATEAADHTRVINERKAAEAKALAARSLDQSQGFILRANELSQEAQRRRLEAGDNIDALGEVTAWHEAELNAAYEGLIPEAQDRVFNSWAGTVNDIRTSYNTALDAAAGQEFDTAISMYPVQMGNLNANTEAWVTNYKMLAERGALANEDPNAVDAAIVGNIRTYMMASADLRNKSPEEIYAYAKQFEDIRDGLIAESPFMAGKQYLLDWNDSIVQIQQQADAITSGRIQDAIDSLDRPNFDKNLALAQENGAVRPEEASTYQLEYATAQVDFNNDPNNIAAAFTRENNAMVSADEGGFAVGSEVRNKVISQNVAVLTEDYKNIANGTATSEDYIRLKGHFDRQTEEGRKVFNQAFDLATSEVQALLSPSSMPSDMNSEEGQAWLGRVQAAHANLNNLYGMGTNLVTEEQAKDYALSDSLLRAKDFVNLREFRQRLAENGNQITPLNSTSNLGKWVIENVPDDDLASALSFGAALQVAGRQPDDRIKEIVEQSYTMADVGGDLQWTRSARGSLEAMGIMTADTQKFAEEILLDPTSDVLPQHVKDQVATVMMGENPRFITVNGVLTLRSGGGDVSLSWTPEQQQAFADEAKTLFGRDNQPMGQQLRNTSLNVDGEVGSVMKPLIDNYSFFNSMTDYAQVEDYGKSMMALGQAQSDAGVTYRNDIADGVPEAEAADKYLAETVPNVMGIVRLHTNNSLSDAEYRQIREFLTTEGKSFMSDRGGMFSYAGDGVFEHLATVGMRYSGADDYSLPERRAAAVELKQAELEAAQQRLSEATGNRDRMNAQGAVDTAQKELEAAIAGDRYMPRAAVSTVDGTRVRPFYSTDTQTAAAPTVSIEVSIAERNLSDAQAAVTEAQQRVSNATAGHSMRTANAQLQRAQEALAIAQQDYEAITIGR